MKAQCGILLPVGNAGRIRQVAIRLKHRRPFFSIANKEALVYTRRELTVSKNGRITER